MKAVIFPVAGALLGITGVYLMAAFIAWDLNAGNWAGPDRALVALFSLFAGAGGFTAASMFSDREAE